MTPTPALGSAIKRARERLRLSQKELAARIGVNVKTVDNWENGRTSPRSSLGALEEVLGDLQGRGSSRDQTPPAADELLDADADDDGLQDLVNRARRERDDGDPTLYKMLLRLQGMSEPQRDSDTQNHQRPDGNQRAS
jgi:transcriptional regulator with XRE-family HTH domain